jgi:hypothetical protein
MQQYLGDDQEYKHAGPHDEKVSTEEVESGVPDVNKSQRLHVLYLLKVLSLLNQSL